MTTNRDVASKEALSFVACFLKEARGLRTLHFYDDQAVRTTFGSQAEQATFGLLNNFASFPFKLTEFAIHSRHNDIPNLSDFLISQPKIECLSIHINGDIVAGPLPIDALPNLAAVSGISDFMVHLAERRPVKYLRLVMREAALQTLEAMQQKSTRPIAAISLIAKTMEEIRDFLPHLSRLAPKLRFLGCEWFTEHSNPTEDDMQLLRTLTELECIRWRCGASIPKKRRRFETGMLNPKFYAGSSLRAVQQEYICDRPSSVSLAKREGVWRPSDNRINRWQFHIGEFIAPPLIPDYIFLVRIVPTDFC